MSPKELIQLSTLLSAEMLPRLWLRHTESPALLGKTISLLESLPLLIEQSFAELATLDRLEVETSRTRDAVARCYCVDLKSAA